MKILTYTLGMVSTNCYLVYDEPSKKACIIDPAEYSSEIMVVISERELAVEYTVFPHGHFDHILGANAFKEKTGTKIAAYELESEYLENPEKSLTSLYGGDMVCADILLKENDVLRFGGLSFRVIHTPGHTKGSCCFICESEKVMFSGDTLFEGTIGRYDFYGGDYATLRGSLQKLKSLSLNGNYTIYAGHGNATTLAKEIAVNPYFK